METFLPIIVIFIILITCCAITMNLHCQRIVTLYRNGTEMVVTFGSFAIALIASGIVCLFLMMLGIQNVDFLIIAYGAIIISILYIIRHSMKMNNDITSILIAIIGNIVWSIAGLFLAAIVAFLLSILFGGNNNNKKHKKHSHLGCSIHDFIK